MSYLCKTIDDHRSQISLSVVYRVRLSKKKTTKVLTNEKNVLSLLNNSGITETSSLKKMNYPSG
jgi:hypothetical protein